MGPLLHETGLGLTLIPSGVGGGGGLACRAPHGPAGGNRQLWAGLLARF